MEEVCDCLFCFTLIGTNTIFTLDDISQVLDRDWITQKEISCMIKTFLSRFYLNAFLDVYFHQKARDYVIDIPIYYTVYQFVKSHWPDHPFKKLMKPIKMVRRAKRRINEPVVVFLGVCKRLLALGASCTIPKVMAMLMKQAMVKMDPMCEWYRMKREKKQRKYDSDYESE